MTDMASERERRIEAALARFNRFDESWATMFRQYVLDGMYQREVVDQRTRELCAVAALCVLQRSGPLRDHIKGAIRQGAEVQQVFEVIAQCSVYGGFPVAIWGIGELEAVLDELGIDPDGTPT